MLYTYKPICIYILKHNRDDDDDDGCLNDHDAAATTILCMCVE